MHAESFTSQGIPCEAASPSKSAPPAFSETGSVQTDGCIVASASSLAQIFPRHHAVTERVRPSLYHDCHEGSGPRSLFTRKIPWLPAPNVLHYVPASLAPNSPHLEAFTRWQQTPRVANGWDQAWSIDKQRQYLQRIQQSDSSLGLIGYWSDSGESLGEMWGYIEIYWAKESNLQPFYDFPDYTMGLHALVGEEAFRGPSRVRAWMSSAVQMMFLVEPRCQLVVSEPLASNTKMIDYECECGGQVEKEIQLPHKRAALVFWTKERFDTLWPLDDRPSIPLRTPSSFSSNVTTSVAPSSSASASPATATAA